MALGLSLNFSRRKVEKEKSMTLRSLLLNFFRRRVGKKRTTPLSKEEILEIVNSREKTIVNLTSMNGNAFVLIGVASRALYRHHKGTAECDEIVQLFKKEALSGNYDHVLQTIMTFCEVE